MERMQVGAQGGAEGDAGEHGKNGGASFRADVKSDEYWNKSSKHDFFRMRSIEDFWTEVRMPV